MADPQLLDEIDRILGERVRARRRRLDKTQAWLGRRVGVCFQQIQKYEGGISRISASMLVSIAAALDYPIGELCAGLAGHDEQPLTAVHRFMTTPAGLELIELGAQLNDDETLPQLIALIRAMRNQVRAAA